MVRISICIVCLALLFSCKKQETAEKTVATVAGSVVINELMPSNSTTAADQDGEYDDWIELYNSSDVSVSLSGYHLSDNKDELKKWTFPTGTSIAAKGYLIIWADKDTTQTGLHANFKLSAKGESLLLVNSSGVATDEVIYTAQSSELSYARIPDGTGSFTWQTATFNKANK